MTTYWLDPNKILWRPDYVGTNDLVVYDEDHPNYKKERLWMNWEWIPTGKHGRYSPHIITKYVEVYPSGWEGKWQDWPRLKLHFKRGVLQDYEDITGKR